MSAEMKPCRLCGVKQSGVDEHNNEYEKLVSLILRSGDERELLELIDIMRSKIITSVTTSVGSSKLAYEDRELYHVQVMHDAISLLREKLISRQ